MSARRRKIVRVSDYYNLGRTQPSLEFVDVDIYGDDRLFVDPTALRLLNTEWTNECAALVQDFFDTVLQAVRDGRMSRARQLLRGLGEPNETHLGVSTGRAKGHAVGRGFANEIAKALEESEAVASGLLEDLEDTVLMLRGIDADIISDITTNVIREPLIRFTQQIAVKYGIPLEEGINSGPLWDPNVGAWTNRFEKLPMTKYGKLLLIPKLIVRDNLIYRPDDYFSNYVLEFLRSEELAAGSALVQLLKNGRYRVTKKDLKAKYGEGKGVALEITLEHPEILHNFRRHKAQGRAEPIDHRDLTAATRASAPDWDDLLGNVTGIRNGSASATRYHRAVESLLTAALHPGLANPRIEQELDTGRKRVDIVYDNVAASGFFWWLGTHYTAPQLMVECKNYSSDPANPELDQLLGRFGNNRGEVGLLVCRRFENKELFLTRCRDAAAAGRGFVIALDDKDLRELVQERRAGRHEFGFLRARFDRLIN